MTHKRSPPLEIVERVLRNLANRNIELWYVDTKSGRLYFGIGLDDLNCYHGVWAFLRGPGMCRPLSFAPNQLKSLVTKTLLEDGCAMLVDMEASGMLREGFYGHA